MRDLNPITAGPLDVKAPGSLYPLSGTLAIQVFATASILAFPVLSPVIPDAGSASVGLYLALVYVGAMAGSYAGGALADKAGPVRVSQWSLGLQAAGLLLLCVPGTASRVFGAMLCGFGYGPITPASSMILARTTTVERVGLVFSLKRTGVPLGGLAAGCALPGLSALTTWHGALLVLAIMTLGIAALCNPLRASLDKVMHTAPPPSSRAFARPVMLILSSPRLRVLATLSLMFSAVQLCVSGYLTAYLGTEANLSLVLAGLVYAAAQAAGMAGRLLWGHLADRTQSSRAVLALVAVLMAASVLGISMLGPDWRLSVVCVIAVCLGATAIGWNGVFLAEVARLAPPGQVATATGGALFFTYIGVVIGPPVFGWSVSQWGNMSMSFAGLALLPCCAVLLILLARPVAAAPR
ncbi:putative MFS-type transporter (plasmid) [Cupriavidus necator H850]|uniref:MFS transporter n=1 Tax=Cupriavidus necator TaxID=106590 RepID=UPI00129E42F0|nr:MFS transporter [Cupriavidus necator]KAI3610253.1 putative MFS-type transporter [Cupriavidus necator H850]